MKKTKDTENDVYICISVKAMKELNKLLACSSLRVLVRESI